MQIISGTTQFKSGGLTALSIGKFDGLHRGHQLLINDIVRHKDKGLKSVVFTFDPPPEIFFGGMKDGRLLTEQEKQRRFEQLGVDILVEFPFNRTTAATPPEDFISNYLVNMLQVRYIAAGPDLSYGDRGKGDFALLQAMGKEYGFETNCIRKLEKDGVPISSTLIRKHIAEGKMEEAARCLGIPFSVYGSIVHGKALGRRIGIPTINIVPDPSKLLPPYGVYYSLVEVDGKFHKGMTNIGVKPTVNDKNVVTVETFLYDFSGDIYGENAQVYLCSFRRKERRFGSVEELKATMQADIEAGRKYDFWAALRLITEDIMLSMKRA